MTLDKLIEELMAIRENKWWTKDLKVMKRVSLSGITQYEYLTEVFVDIDEDKQNMIVIN